MTDKSLLMPGPLDGFFRAIISKAQKISAQSWIVKLCEKCSQFLVIIISLWVDSYASLLPEIELISFPRRLFLCRNHGSSEIAVWGFFQDIQK